MGERERLKELFIQLGYPKEFAEQCTAYLKTEKAQRRMIGYLLRVGAVKPEMIADEMISIREEHDQWRRKKEAEYYNSQYNELLLRGLPQEEDE